MNALKNTGKMKTKDRASSEKSALFAFETVRLKNKYFKQVYANRLDVSS